MKRKSGKLLKGKALTVGELRERINKAWAVFVAYTNPDVTQRSSEGVAFIVEGETEDREEEQFGYFVKSIIIEQVTNWFGRPDILGKPFGFSFEQVLDKSNEEIAAFTDADGNKVEFFNAVATSGNHPDEREKQ